MLRPVLLRFPGSASALLLAISLGLSALAQAQEDLGPPSGGKPPSARPIRGKIFGYKFNDLNKNGVDDQEPRLAGITVRLVNLGPYPVERETVTNALGQFSFQNLRLQTYQVCEVVPVANPPWVPTRPECVNVTLTRKHRVRFVLYGNHQEEDGNGGGTGCTRTQGFWGSSPAGQALVPILVPGTLALGNRGYTAAELDDVLDVPTAGNALLILAHQLIAAKLNVLAGASSAPIAATIAAADAAIGNLVIPPVGADFVAPASMLGQQMVVLASTLASYNEGNLGVPHCP